MTENRADKDIRQENQAIKRDYNELAAQYEVLRQEKQYLELEVAEIRSDGELHSACLHMGISVSLGDNVAELQRATERKNRFLSKVLTKVTASRNEMCEIFIKMNEMTREAGLGHCDFSSVMGPAEKIEGTATFLDTQTGTKKSMKEDWAKLGRNLRERLATGHGEVFRNCFEKKLVNTAANTAEMATQTDRKVDTPRMAKEKKRILRRKMMKRK